VRAKDLKLRAVLGPYVAILRRKKPQLRMTRVARLRLNRKAAGEDLCDLKRLVEQNDVRVGIGMQHAFFVLDA
jgi:hypothetical protein